MMRILPLLLLVQILGVRAAGAQARDPAAGEALFQEGRRLMKSRDFAAACPKLEESLRLDPAAGTLVNLAACEEELGRTATAWQHWRAAVDQLANTDRRRAAALARADALEKVLARLTISLAPGGPGGVEVSRDGVKLGAATFGLALPVDPGDHVVVVTAPGREDRRYDLTVRPKESKALAVEAGAEVKLPDPEPPGKGPALWSETGQNNAGTNLSESAPSPEAPATWKRPLGYGLVVAGALALGGAAYTGLQVKNARNELATACPAGAGGPCLNARDALDRDKRFSLYTDVAGGAGLLFLAAGLFFVFTGGGSHEVATAQVGPLPGGGEVRLVGRF